MTITKEIEIDMGHRVPNHKSKCRNLHGHRYKIEVAVDDKIITTPGASDEGMVIDFGDIKDILMKEIDALYDHSFMMYADDTFAEYFKAIRDDGQKINIVPFIPTAENLAVYWYACLLPCFAERNITLKYVKVWETPTSTATYGEVY